jgi:hypothetical protein
MDERGGVSIEITIGSACPRTRKENAASEEQRNGYRFNGKKRMRERIERFVCKGACANLLSQRKTFASAIKRLWLGKGGAALLPGVQEHENRVQLNPEKGYLTGNESEI